MQSRLPVVLAISAASSSIYGVRTLEFLLKNNFPTELIISENAYYIINQELNIELEHDKQLIRKKILGYLGIDKDCDLLRVWLNDELWASPSSGSYKISGMIISPASMSTVASIASGLSSNLIERAADVAIKEGKKLVIVPRETPFSVIHLENMLKLSKMGVKIVPPIPGFYTKIQTVDDIINFAVGKTLDVFGIDNDLYKRWKHE